MKKTLLFSLITIFIISCNSPTKHTKIEASINIIYPRNDSNTKDLGKIIFSVDTDIAFDGIIKLFIDDQINRSQEYFFDTIPRSNYFYVINNNQFETYGDHNLSLELFDSNEKLLNNSQINISKNVVLYQPINNDNILNIYWDEYHNTDFKKYTLLRSEYLNMENSQIIFSTENIKNNRFFDSEININERKYYQLLTVLDTGDTIPSDIVIGSTFQKIIYVAYHNEDYASFDIFSVDIDGNNNYRLTDTYESEHLPSFSPDGNDIIFGDGNSILKMNLAGYSIKDLNLVNSSEPKFTPDGTKIIYLSQQDGNSDIFIMDSSGNNQQNLTNTENHEWEYDIASNIEKIVYSDFNDIYIMDFNGKNKKKLTSNEAQCTHPIFSNDDQSIFYYSNSDIYKIAIDGSNMINLTDEFDDFLRSPNLSPTQNEIVCYSADGICIINIDWICYIFSDT